jgi:hypothetical protein
MPEQNGPPAEGNPAPDEEQVSTAALVAAMELVRGMSGNPAATPGDQLMDDIEEGKSAPRSSPGRSRSFCTGSCRCSTTPR